MQDFQKIAFIGGGNMAKALLQGLLAAAWPKSAFSVADPNPQAQAYFAALGIPSVSHASALLAASPPALLILAVKPQVALSVLQESALPPGVPVLSVVAGLPLAVLAQALAEEPTDRPWLRAMPNTPALLQQGMTGMYASENVNESLKETAAMIFQSVGQVLWLTKEAALDAITAVSGSGPAYLFYWLSAWLKAAQALGFSEADANLLVLQTAEGALSLAKSALSQGQTLAELQAQVASKGGTTEAALAYLQAQGVDQHLSTAMLQALARARSLAADFYKLN